MTPLESQIIKLQEVYPGADKNPLGDGSVSIILPNVPLPHGWSAAATTVRFIAPVGFPAARPDCFWTDSLTLATGAVPKNTGPNPLPGGPPGLLWFSWHVSNWSPNHDTLLTYVNVIRKRFDERQ